MFIQWLFAPLMFLVHPFYVSMTEINHNTSNKSVEISVRIFADDLEDAIKKNCQCNIDLLKPADKALAERYINTYIQRNFQVKVDGQPKTLVFVGYQQEDLSIWSHYEISNVSSIKQLEISNSLLHDHLNEQVNMITIKANGKQQTEKLDYPKKDWVVKY
jgi:hypothetical protein